MARMVLDSDPAQAREALTIIEITTRRSLHELRLLVGVLRSPGQDFAREDEPEDWMRYVLYLGLCRA